MLLVTSLFCNISKVQKVETADVLSFPTVMIVTSKEEVLFDYINPNYKQRISSEILLAILKTIK